MARRTNLDSLHVERRGDDSPMAGPPPPLQRWQPASEQLLRHRVEPHLLEPPSRVHQHRPDQLRLRDRQPRSRPEPVDEGPAEPGRPLAVVGRDPAGDVVVAECRQRRRLGPPE